MTMKHFMTTLALLTILGKAQGQEMDIHSAIRDREAAQAESDYLRTVQSALTPKAVSDYQIMAVEYDVAQSDLFDGRDALFLVIFRTQKGSIEASYDWSGVVVETIERFRNLALPRKILLSGMKRHSGWRVIGTNYYVYYVKNRSKRILYTIQIADGNKRKRILLDSEGAVIN